jgi:hypothetical protein
MTVGELFGGRCGPHEPRALSAASAPLDLTEGRGAATPFELEADLADGVALGAARERLPLLDRGGERAPGWLGHHHDESVLTLMRLIGDLAVYQHEEVAGDVEILSVSLRHRCGGDRCGRGSLTGLPVVTRPRLGRHSGQQGKVIRRGGQQRVQSRAYESGRRDSERITAGRGKKRSLSLCGNRAHYEMASGTYGSPALGHHLVSTRATSPPNPKTLLRWQKLSLVRR